MSTESIERSKQEARDYEEIGDYFSEIIENIVTGILLNGELLHQRMQKWKFMIRKKK